MIFKKKMKVNLKSINLLVTPYCNLKCKMCEYTEGTKNVNAMSTEELKDVISQARELGLERLELSGGEPMMKKDIYDIISYSKSIGVKRIVMMTNGVLIGKEEAQKLVEAGLGDVVFSLEGHKELNDKIRGKGSFDKTVEAIKNLQNYDSINCVRVNITLNKLNYSSTLDFIKYLVEDLNIKSISINPYNPFMFGPENKYVESLKVTDDDMDKVQEALEKIIAYVKSKDIDFSHENYLRKFIDFFKGEKLLPLYGCDAPLNSCAIDITGGVHACWGDKELSGNIRETSLKKIVSNKHYLEFCQDALDKKCEGCLNTCYDRIYN